MQRDVFALRKSNVVVYFTYKFACLSDFNDSHCRTQAYHIMFTENDQAEQHSSTHKMQMLHMHVNIYMSSDTFFRAGEINFKTFRYHFS